MSSMLFCWIPGDVYREVQPKWEQLAYGVTIQEYRFTLLAWADDTWLIAEATQELAPMIADARETALRRAGLEFRIPKCHWSLMQRREKDLPELPVAQDNPSLQAMRRVPQEIRLKSSPPSSNAMQGEAWSSRP